MLTDILSIAHNATTLLFGVFISAAFLGIQMNRKNILSLFAFSAAVGLADILIFIFFGGAATARIYPLVVHLPLILFLTLFYKYKPLLSVISVLTAYFCCQISKWVGLVALEFSQLDWVYYAVRIAATIIVFAVLIRYVSAATAQLSQKPPKALLIFALMPLTYYLFDYTTSVYTALLYSGKGVIVEFLGFALCIAYLLFLLVYFKQYEEKHEAEQRSRMMELQRTQFQKEIEANKRSARAVTLLRHDMRHFLSNISAFIDSGEIDQAKEYIAGIISSVDDTVVRQYCKNEIVNMILFSYEPKIQKHKIDFQYSIQIPEQLSVSGADLTSILSNALENAIHAVTPLEADKRHIVLHLRMHDDKLLISIKNTFAEKPVFIDDLPRSSEAGHGFGTQSIRYVTEKLHGNCQFFMQDDWFILQMILSSAV